MFVRGKESSEELWSDVSHFPGEVPLTPPAPANKHAMRDEETLMTKASNNEERSASPPKRLLIACVLAALVVAGCSADEKQAGGAKPVARVAAEVEPSVVQVNVQAVQETPSGLEEAQGLGSGVIYREDGYIITNNHVVEGANEVNVAFVDGSSEGGEVVGGDRSTDIAVVRVDRDGLPAADFAENLSLRVGELAVALGSPSGFQSTVTAGVISGLGREVPPEVTGGQAQDPSLVDLIQTDAAISPGSSGGALANEDGEVVGINVAYLPPAQTGAVNIGFAIPSPAAVSVADQLIEDGEADHPYLGVSLANLTPEIAEQFGISAESGVLVTDVDPKGPAAEAGIEPGIVLTALGSQEVADTGDLLAALRDYGPGDTVELAVAAEAGETREVSVELGERG
jgi:S1-C subfamily serine protease